MGIETLTKTGGLITLEDYDLLNCRLVYFSGMGWKVKNPFHPDCTIVSPAGAEFRAADFDEDILNLRFDENPDREEAEALWDLLYTDAALFKGICTRRLFTLRNP